MTDAQIERVREKLDKLMDYSGGTVEGIGVEIPTPLLVRDFKTIMTALLDELREE